MTSSEACYYLHENGSLIFKPHGGVEVEPGGFVRHVWSYGTVSKSPKNFTAFLVDALNRGAARDRVVKLAEHAELTRFVTVSDPDNGRDIYDVLRRYVPGSLSPRFD